MASHMEVLRGYAKSFQVGASSLARQLDWLFPAQSLISGVPLASNGRLTPDEFSRLEFLSAPQCEACGFPFEHDEGEGILCAGCLAERPVYDRARAAFVYGDDVAKMVLSLKRQGQRTGLKFFARRMEEAASDLLSDAELLIPVPLHYRRLAMRGFNQSGWLADALSKETGLPVSHGLLKRTKATPSQGLSSPHQRRANVRNAFAVRAEKADWIKGQNILLVDDVYTTGATIEACARALRKAGAARIDVVTLARVVAPKKPII